MQSTRTIKSEVWSIIAAVVLALILGAFMKARAEPAPGPLDGPNVQALQESRDTRQHAKGFWAKARRISEAVLIGGHVADVHSSLTAPQGLYEGNGLLRGQDGRFGRKGLVIKSAAVGGMIVAQRLANRNGKHDKLVTFINFAQCGVAIGIAARNYRLEPTGSTVPTAYVTASEPYVGGGR